MILMGKSDCFADRLTYEIAREQKRRCALKLLHHQSGVHDRNREDERSREIREAKEEREEREGIRRRTRRIVPLREKEGWTIGG